MPAVLVIDRSAKEPSPLVQRLIPEGYHTLCLADCHTALETLRCIRPELLIIDVAWLGRDAAAGLLKVVHGNGGGEKAVPVMLIGAEPADYRVLAPLLKRGEIRPATASSPDAVVTRVRQYVDPIWSIWSADMRVQELALDVS